MGEVTLLSGVRYTPSIRDSVCNRRCNAPVSNQHCEMGKEVNGLLHIRVPTVTEINQLLHRIPYLSLRCLQVCFVYFNFRNAYETCAGRCCGREKPGPLGHHHRSAPEEVDWHGPANNTCGAVCWSCCSGGGATFQLGGNLRDDTYVCMYMCVHVCVCVCVCVCVYLCMYVCICICPCTSTYSNTASDPVTDVLIHNSKRRYRNSTSYNALLI